MLQVRRESLGGGRAGAGLRLGASGGDGRAQRVVLDMEPELALHRNVTMIPRDGARLWVLAPLRGSATLARCGSPRQT